MGKASLYRPAVKRGRETVDTIAPSKTQAGQPGRERRAWPRTPRKIRVLVLPDDCALDEPYAGWIIDSSPGGVRLAIEHLALGVGTTICLRHPSPARASWMTARIKHRQRHGDLWVFGCEFVRVRLARPARCA